LVEEEEEAEEAEEALETEETAEPELISKGKGDEGTDTE